MNNTLVKAVPIEVILIPTHVHSKYGIYNIDTFDFNHWEASPGRLDWGTNKLPQSNIQRGENL